MEPFTPTNTLAGFLASFPPMPDADVEAERVSDEAKQVKKASAKAQACRDEYLRDVPVIASCDDVAAHRLVEKQAQIREFNERLPTFEVATSFSVWARGRTVKINGENVPVTLWNLPSYFSGVRPARPLEVFQKFAWLARSEHLKDRIDEVEYNEVIQGFGSLFAPSFRDITTPELAQIYSVDNDYEGFEKYIGSLFLIQIRDVYWGPVVTSWVEKGWITEEKKGKLFAEFDMLFSDDVPVVRVDDVADLFAERDTCRNPCPSLGRGPGKHSCFAEFAEQSLPERNLAPLGAGGIQLLSPSVLPRLQANDERAPMIALPQVEKPKKEFLKKSSSKRVMRKRKVPKVDFQRTVSAAAACAKSPNLPPRSVSCMRGNSSTIRALPKMRLPQRLSARAEQSSPFASPMIPSRPKPSSNSPLTPGIFGDRFSPLQASPLMGRVSLSSASVRSTLTPIVNNIGCGIWGFPSPPPRSTSRMCMEESPRLRRMTSDGVSTTRIGMGRSPRPRRIPEGALATPPGSKGSDKVSPGQSSVTVSFKGSPTDSPY